MWCMVCALQNENVEKGWVNINEDMTHPGMLKVIYEGNIRDVPLHLFPFYWTKITLQNCLNASEKKE